MEIKDLKPSDLEHACTLFSVSYLRQHELVHALDVENARADNILPLIEECMEKHLGVAAWENGTMIGYMTGFYIDRFLGVHRGAMCPEWAHGSVNDGAFEIYRHMYQRMGQRWVDDGCLTHCVNTMNFAGKVHESFFWNGFGGICIDAMRMVEPLEISKQEDVQIRPVEENDIPEWIGMVEAHNVHLTASPAFKPYTENDKVSEEELSVCLREPGSHAWIAWLGNEAAGYMKIAPEEDGAGWIVGGNDKFAVNGAYVNPKFRGRGIAKMLLGEIMDWAGKHGFVRCSVDFEATNLEACNFWLRYFKPVCRSFVRRLDERILKK